MVRTGTTLVPVSEVAESLASALDVAREKRDITVEGVRLLIRKITAVFRGSMVEAGYDARQVTRLTTKFRDAGRRSAPWRATSKRIPGRPQDGADGNRISRWKLPKVHKFYATEIDATLVEVKYYLQALSMEHAPAMPIEKAETAFSWLVEHDVRPGVYLDPIQLISLDLREIIQNARLLHSGHLVPLDRGGRHEPGNAFLMLARSNQLQGNMKLPELLKLMEDILARHRAAGHLSQ
jgi:hypothetical protein